MAPRSAVFRALADHSAGGWHEQGIPAIKQTGTADLREGSSETGNDLAKSGAGRWRKNQLEADAHPRAASNLERFGPQLEPELFL